MIALEAYTSYHRLACHGMSLLLVLFPAMWGSSELLGGNFRGYAWAYDANNIRLAKYCTLQAQTSAGGSAARAPASSGPDSQAGDSSSAAASGLVGQGPSLRLYLSNRYPRDPPLFSSFYVNASPGGPSSSISASLKP